MFFLQSVVDGKFVSFDLGANRLYLTPAYMGAYPFRTRDEALAKLALSERQLNVTLTVKEIPCDSTPTNR